MTSDEGESCGEVIPKLSVSEKLHAQHQKKQKQENPRSARCMLLIQMDKLSAIAILASLTHCETKLTCYDEQGRTMAKQCNTAR